MDDNKTTQTEKKWSSSLDGSSVGSFVAKVEDLVRTGSTRRIAVRRNRGLWLPVKVPLLVGIGVAILAFWLMPRFLAIAAVAALFFGVSLDVEDRTGRSRDVEDVEYRHVD